MPIATSVKCTILWKDITPLWKKIIEAFYDFSEELPFADGFFLLKED